MLKDITINLADQTGFNVLELTQVCIIESYENIPLLTFSLC